MIDDATIRFFPDDQPELPEIPKQEKPQEPTPPPTPEPVDWRPLGVEW